MDTRHIRTRLAHSGNEQFGKKMQQAVSLPKVLPVYLSSVFSFDDVPSLDAVYEGNAGGYIYSRMGNPSTDALQEMLAAAEQADGALVFATGMAAIITAVIGNVQSGDHIVSSPVLYGGVCDYFKNELSRFGVEVTFTDLSPASLEAAIRPNTRLVYTETICNPLMEVADIPTIADIAHAHGCKFIIDNTFASPSIVRPLELGADIVVYSSTKYLGGHSDIMGGAILANGPQIAELERYAVLYGAIMGPMEAWLLARSLRTLDLRVQQHSENALAVARFLEGHPKVERVHYPGLDSSPYKPLADKLFTGGRCGGMLSADIINGEAGASALIKACENIHLAPSLGGYATNISYPAKTSHRNFTPQELQAAGIPMGQLRFSIGLEAAEDIIAELDAALKQV